MLVGSTVGVAPMLNLSHTSCMLPLCALIVKQNLGTLQAFFIVFLINNFKLFLKQPMDFQSIVVEFFKTGK